MKISISGHAAAFTDDDQEITAATALKELAGVKSDDSCVEYLDETLAEIGLVGGHLEFVNERLPDATVWAARGGRAFAFILRM